VDDDAPRLTFVRHPVSYELVGEKPSSIDIPVHPNHEDMGTRTWSLKDGTVWLEGDDLEKMDVRLKEFADVALNDQEATIESLERQDQRPIIHWVPVSAAKEAMLLETRNNEVIRTFGQLEQHTYPAGTIVQLERIGYARIMEDGSLVVCHEQLQEN
jgi:glutamyl/glutaminyl-tRNA synthetase